MWKVLQFNKGNNFQLHGVKSARCPNRGSTLLPGCGFGSGDYGRSQRRFGSGDDTPTFQQLGGGFQIFIFTWKLGEIFTNLSQYLSDGLKPPTRKIRLMVQKSGKPVQGW